MIERRLRARPRHLLTRTIVVAIAAVAVAGLLSASRSFATTRSSATDPDEWQPVLTLVEQIKAEPDVGPRTHHAEEVSDFVRAKNGKSAPKSGIRALAGLMTDRHDSVRYWIAMALGFFGPQAIEAVPALQTALKEIEGRPGSKTSESAIRLALRRINARAK